MTNSIREIEAADVIFVIGSNTTENHPVIGAKIRQAKLKGAKLIVADPRRIDLAKDADYFLQIKPGTNIALLNGLMHCIIDEGLQDHEYIRTKTENFKALREQLKEYTPEKVAEICGVEPEDIRQAARIYAKGERAGIFYAMGITQHTTGTKGVMAISNLALLCGNVGKTSAGVNPLRGQNNVQGACDMGGLPGDLPGYQKLHSAEVIEKFERAWNVRLSAKPGLTIPEMLDKAEAGLIKFMYIMGENPMVSDPDIQHVQKALEKLDFLIVQDIFLSETAALADVVLPAVSFAEKDGTFTNTERRVQLVRRAIQPIGQAKADWKILMELMNLMGYPNTYHHPEEIMNEISSLTPQYGGISHDRLSLEGIQWPCPTKEHPGTPYLHKDGIARGLGLFVPVEYEASAELPDGDYPLVLTTGRILYHYHTRTMTGRVEGLNQISNEAYVEINPITAEKFGMRNQESIYVISRRGKVTVKVYTTKTVEENVLFMPFHFAEGAANHLTNRAIDNIAKIPELKVCAVRIEKIDDPFKDEKLSFGDL
ncbi:MAG: fdhF2 [Anaerosolibacter sp.]|jgi:formate dehydrogenase major subunit|nr:fdhF2 [Anaerosolibacter sp.]